MRNYRIKVIETVTCLKAFLYKLSRIFFLIVIIISLFLLPVKFAPSEMKAAYFVFVLPKYVQYGYIISWLGIIITISISIIAKCKKKALLVFGEDAVSIRGRAMHLNIFVSTISKVVFMDLHPETKYAKARVTIYYHPNQVINFELQRYIQAENFFNHLATYSGLPMEISNHDETRFEYELKEKNRSR